MIRKIIKTILLLSVITVFVVGISFYISATKWSSKTLSEVEVARGMSVRGIATLLEKKGIIGAPKLFEIFVRIKGIENDLKSGTYDFPVGTTMMSAIESLRKGDVRQYTFTIIEGWTVRDIANALKAKPFITDENMPEEFERFAFDKEFTRSLGFDSPSLEGYLYPDTYKVNYPLRAKEFLKRLTDMFKKVYGDVTANANLPLSENEVVTLASIVEKETGVASERPLIAGVFFNRIKRGIALQSDPTIIYGLPNYDGNIRKRDISNPHPYNTYVHAGLPPGPICNPGKASIEAVIHPEISEYIYFVSKNDGSHYFSRTLTEHLNAVRKYQIYRNRK